MMRSLVALMVVALLGGCAATPEQAPPSDAACQPTAVEDPLIRFLNTTDDPIAPITDQALAWDFSTYNVRTCSLAAIGHHELREGDPHNYLGEIDMRGDIGAVAVLGNGEVPMIYVLDISNRSTPQVLSTIEQAGTYITDVKIGDGGRYLFAASQSLPTPGELYGLPGLSPTAPTGFTVYDISDPASPAYVTTVADPQVGCHMLSHEIVGTTHVVACVSQQVRLHAFDTTGGQFTYITFVDYFPSSGPMGLPNPSGIPAVGDPTGGEMSSGPHDMIIQRDPVTDDLLMIVSHWNEGVRVVDLNDAPVATELGAWTGEGATHYAGNVHTAMMVYANGTRYIIASPEYTGGLGAETPPSLWVLDATDLSDLKLVAEWTHPGEHPSQGLYLTTHQWQVAPSGPDVATEDVRVYLTYNHAGIWVLGLDDVLQGDSQEAIKGFHLSRMPLDQDQEVGNARLSTWDVNVVDGYIYGSDRATGLWIFHYEEDTLGDASRTGFA